jgi:hypothetical protein
MVPAAPITGSEASAAGNCAGRIDSSSPWSAGGIRPSNLWAGTQTLTPSSRTALAGGSADAAGQAPNAAAQIVPSTAARIVSSGIV